MTSEICYISEYTIIYSIDTKLIPEKTQLALMCNPIDSWCRNYWLHSFRPHLQYFSINTTWTSSSTHYVLFTTIITFWSVSKTI